MMKRQSWKVVMIMMTTTMTMMLRMIKEIHLVGCYLHTVTDVKSTIPSPTPIGYLCKCSSSTGSNQEGGGGVGCIIVPVVVQ